MKTVSEVMQDMKSVQAELAYVSDQLGMARLARRSVRDRIAQACVSSSQVDQVIRSWRAPTPGEVAEVDAVHERTAPTINEFLPRERALKAAIRSLEIDLKAARKASKTNGQTGEKPGVRPGNGFSPVEARPLRKPGPGNPAPGSLPLPGVNRGVPVDPCGPGSASVGGNHDEW